MKIVLAIFLLSFATTALAQTSPVEQAAAPGCGKDDVKFDVKTDKSQHPFAKPDPGKALVYLLQDDTDFLSNPRPDQRRFSLGGRRPDCAATHSSNLVHVHRGNPSAFITFVRGGNPLLASPLVRNLPRLSSMLTPAASTFLLFGITRCRKRYRPE